MNIQEKQESAKLLRLGNPKTEVVEQKLVFLYKKSYIL